MKYTKYRYRIAVLLVVLVLMSLLYGCSQDGPTATQVKSLTVSEIVTGVSEIMDSLTGSNEVSEYETSTEDGKTTYTYSYFDTNGLLIITEENGNVVEFKGYSMPAFFSVSDPGTMAELAASVPATVLCSDVRTRFDELKKQNPDQTSCSFTYEGWEYSWEYFAEDPSKEIQEIYVVTVTRL